MRELIGSKHCVVCIPGFFEYNQQEQGTYRVERVDGQPFYIARIWDIWFDIKTGMPLPTFAMITMPPHAAMAEIHYSMPLFLERADIKKWINSSYTAEQRAACLPSKPCPPDDLKIDLKQKAG